jgi:TrpR-related protein YerC/YecD
MGKAGSRGGGCQTAVRGLTRPEKRLHKAQQTAGQREEQMKKSLNKETVTQLFKAILTLKDMEECHLFFEDICTINELNSLAQRFDVGRRLLEGQTYQTISEATSASTATISRVGRLLDDGKEGIEMAAERIREKAREE